MPTLASFPELVAQIDRKNGPIAPETIAYTARRKLWWRCPAGPDHLWEVAVSHRTMGGTGCPFCSGRLPSAANNLAVVYPGLADEWHPTKNGDLRPEDVTPGSGRPVYWKCARGHEWQTSPAQRMMHGCPFCAGRRVAPEHSLAALAPAVARQWDRAKNGDLTPHDVTVSSSRQVFWKCPKGPDHRWQTTVHNRGAVGRGCPFCKGQRLSVTNSLATCLPELAREWHPTKNGELTPRDVVARAALRAFWRCASGHEWQAVVAARAGRREDDATAGEQAATGTGCPYCSNHLVSPTNSLAARFPELAREWHPTKNGRLAPNDVAAHSHRRVWWRCASGHEWRTSVVTRVGHRPGRAVAGSGSKCSACPYCANRLASPTNSLAARFPELAREWHPMKNGRLTPRDVLPGTRRRVWWRCRLRHEWQTSPANRSSGGTSCPRCAALR
jgi:hypothetical protein